MSRRQQQTFPSPLCTVQAICTPLSVLIKLRLAGYGPASPGADSKSQVLVLGVLNYGQVQNYDLNAMILFEKDPKVSPLTPSNIYGASLYLVNMFIGVFHVMLT